VNDENNSNETTNQNPNQNFGANTKVFTPPSDGRGINEPTAISPRDPFAASRRLNTEQIYSNSEPGATAQPAAEQNQPAEAAPTNTISSLVDSNVISNENSSTTPPANHEVAPSSTVSTEAKSLTLNKPLPTLLLIIAIICLLLSVVNLWQFINLTESYVSVRDSAATLTQLTGGEYDFNALTLQAYLMQSIPLLIQAIVWVLVGILLLLRKKVVLSLAKFVITAAILLNLGSDIFVRHTISIGTIFSVVFIIFIITWLSQHIDTDKLFEKKKTIRT